MVGQRKIKTKFGTFTLARKPSDAGFGSQQFRINQVVKIQDITGRRGSQIGTAKVAFGFAKDVASFKKQASDPFAKVKVGDILNRRFKVVGI